MKFAGRLSLFKIFLESHFKNLWQELWWDTAAPFFGCSGWRDCCIWVCLPDSIEAVFCKNHVEGWLNTLTLYSNNRRCKKRIGWEFCSVDFMFHFGFPKNILSSDSRLGFKWISWFLLIWDLPPVPGMCHLSQAAVPVAPTLSWTSSKFRKQRHPQKKSTRKVGGVWWVCLVLCP